MISTKNLLARSGVLMGTAAAALAATAALGAGTASAAAAPVSASASVHTNIAVHPNEIIFGNCGEWFGTHTYANIRSGAGTYNSVVGEMAPGQDFAATVKTSYSYSGYFWVEGYDVETQKHGWIALGSWIYDEGPAYCTVLS